MRKIVKNILTAINNPILNEELKKEKNIKVLFKDIQYKEAVLEILEKENLIDVLIIKEQIIGEMDFLELLKKIREKNAKIKIIVVLKKENKEKEKMMSKFKVIFLYEKNLEKNNLIKIIFNNEKKNITENNKQDKIIENKINKKKLEKENKKIIINYKLIDLKNKKIFNKIKNKISKNQNKNTEKISNKKMNIKINNKKINSNKNRKINKNKKNNENKKIIFLIGENQKNIKNFIIDISKLLYNKKYKILIINFSIDKDLKTKNRNTIFVKKTTYDKILKFNYNKINILENYIFFKTISSKIRSNPKTEKSYLSNDIFYSKFNYIFINLKLPKNFNRFQQIMKKSYKNIIFVERTILGLEEIQNTMRKIRKETNIPLKSLHIVMKNTKNQISKEIIKNVLEDEFNINKIRVLTQKNIKRKIFINLKKSKG